MIRVIWKKRLIVLVSLLLAACGAIDKKVYYVDPSVGLVRRQDGEVLEFAKARGYLCESPKDFEATATCSGASVKVYFLEPSQGLIRKQQNEVKPFPEAKGYLCLKPKDFQKLLEQCSK